MKRDTAYIKGLHQYAFRSGEWAEIAGVEMITPSKGMKVRACFHVKFHDGKEDWVPISDLDNYEISSLEQV